MKRWQVFVAVLLLAAVRAWAVPPALHVVNTGSSGSPVYQVETVGGNCPVRLVGVNVDCLEWAANGQQTTNGITEGILQTVQEAITNWNVNIVRIPIDQDWWDGNAQSTRGSTSQSTYQGIVDSIVSLCQNDNIYCDLDLQWSGDGPTGSATQQYSMPDQNSLVFWTSVASRYANNTSVLFDTFNEPFTNSWSVWAAGGTANEGFSTPGLQAIVNTIRQQNAANICIVGGQQYSYYFSGMTPITNPNCANGTPGNGVMYSAHIYNNKGTNNSTGWQSNIDPALAYGPVLIEEFGNSANTTDNGSFVSSVLTWMNGANDKNYVYGGMAWELGTEATPLLVSDWNWTLTSYEGTTVKAWLAGLTTKVTCGSPVATSTSTLTQTPTDTPTDTRTDSPTATRTDTPTDTPSVTRTDSPTATPTGTPTVTRTDSPSATPTGTSTGSPTATATGAVSGTSTVTPADTASPSRTGSPSATPTPTVSSTVSATPILTASFSPTFGNTKTWTVGPAGTFSATVTGSSTASATPDATASSSPTSTASSSPTSTASPTAAATGTISPVSSATASPTASPTPTDTPVVPVLFPPSFFVTSGTPADVTLTGANFAPGDTVLVNGVSYTPLTLTPTTIVFALPAQPPAGAAYGVLNTFVVSAQGYSSGNGYLNIHTAYNPAIFPVLNPITFSVQTGAAVDITLTGSNFAAGDMVIFGNNVFQTFPLTATSTSLLVSVPVQVSPVALTVQVFNPELMASLLQTLAFKNPVPQTPASGPLAISAALPVPNPNPKAIAVDLAGPADLVEVMVYTKALRLALDFSSGGLTPGWNAVALPQAWNSLPSGIYYVRVRAVRGAAVSAPVLAKAVRLR